MLTLGMEPGRDIPRENSSGNKQAQEDEHEQHLCITSDTLDLYSVRDIHARSSGVEELLELVVDVT